MARIRTIKPEFWGDEKVSPLAPVDRLVFLGLICMADDAGRLVDNVKVIDAFIFPNTDDSAAASVETLVQLGRIIRGRTASGQGVLQVVNWAHQKIDKPNLSSALPPIVEGSEASPTPPRRVDDASAKPPRSVVEASPTHIYYQYQYQDQDPPRDASPTPRAPVARDRAATPAPAAWLTPWLQAYAAVGAIKPGRLAKIVAPLRDQPEALLAWQLWCALPDLRRFSRATPQGFVTTWRDVLTDAERVSPAMVFLLRERAAESATSEEAA